MMVLLSMALKKPKRKWICPDHRDWTKRPPRLSAAKALIAVAESLATTSHEEQAMHRVDAWLQQLGRPFSPGAMQLSRAEEGVSRRAWDLESEEKRE